MQLKTPPLEAGFFHVSTYAMLILTRRPGESLILELPTGERIKVTVLEVKGNQIRIGTDAPDDIAIVREELLESAIT